jgi:hypothetical protein
VRISTRKIQPSFYFPTPDPTKISPQPLARPAGSIFLKFFVQLSGDFSTFQPLRSRQRISPFAAVDSGWQQGSKVFPLGNAGRLVK